MDTSTTSSSSLDSSPATAWNPTELKVFHDRFYPVALELADGSVLPPRADPALILRNVRIGVAAVRGELARVRSELPGVQWSSLDELPELAAAMVFASTLVLDPVGDGEIQAGLARVRPVRREMIRSAEMLARRGLLPADRVKAIKEGSGPLDTALDVVALANLYATHWEAIAGKHPFTRDEITAFGKDGDFLVQAITPAGGRKEARVASAVSPRQVRDRLYALLAGRHEELRRVASFLWGAEADRRVPKLSSRIAAGRVRVAPTNAMAGIAPTPATPSTPSA